MRYREKWKKVVAISASILGLLVIAIIIGWHFFKKDIQSDNSTTKPIVAKGIKKVVSEASDSLYQVKFSNFNLKIDSGYADITNLRISADTSIYKKLVAERKAPNNIITATADKISMSNFGFQKVQGEQALHIGSLRINNLYVHIANKIRSYNDTAHSKSLIASAINGLLKSVDTDNIVELKIDNIFYEQYDFCVCK